MDGCVKKNHLLVKKLSEVILRFLCSCFQMASRLPFLHSTVKLPEQIRNLDKLLKESFSEQKPPANPNEVLKTQANGA